MLGNQNNENDPIFTIESLDLDFSKKKRQKSTTYPTIHSDRKHSIQNLQQQPIKTDRSVLIEKKRNYSEAVRQRNQNLLLKKKNETNCQTGNQENLEQSQLFEIKENMNIEPLKLRTASRAACRLQKSNNKARSGKKTGVNATSIDFQPIPFTLDSTTYFDSCEIEHSSFYSPRSKDLKQQTLNSPKFKPHVQAQPNKTASKPHPHLQVHSNVYSERIVVLDSDATILAKQNTTFKKDLANFRKQNSVLRKQLQDAKNHVFDLEEKTKLLLEGSFLKSGKNSLEEEEPGQEIQGELLGKDEISNGAEIIDKLRQQIAYLKNLNSSLELRTYIAEKKMTEEVNLVKKKMAKEIHDWRDKCTQLRAQNIKYKKIRDVTLSMEISKDQQ